MKHSEFICEGSSDQSVCSGLPFYNSYKSHRLCILHNPSSTKSLKAFVEAVDAKFDRDDFNFAGTWFPDELQWDLKDEEFLNDVDFSDCVFENEISLQCTFRKKANFANCEFKSSVDLEGSRFCAEAQFSRSNFDGYLDVSRVEFLSSVKFDYCTFAGSVTFSAGFSGAVEFEGAIFSGEVDFEDSEFRGEVSFYGSRFEQQTNFTETKFTHDVSFNFATFCDSVRFGNPSWGGSCFIGESNLSLAHCKIEYPNRFSFHTLRLKPAWFINVDVKNLVFTNVEWDPVSIEENGTELDSLRLLAITYRQLALNAEENHRYSEASKFRYLAMDAARVERGNHRRWNRRWWRQQNTLRSKLRNLRLIWRGLSIWDLNWWYWVASGYGERLGRAVLGLVTIWFFFSIVFTFVGFVRWEPKTTTETEAKFATIDAYGGPLPLRKALTYSAAVITLQKPEPKPATAIAKSSVLLLTVLGPTQAALMALAIRRRFMR